MWSEELRPQQISAPQPVVWAGQSRIRGDGRRARCAQP